MCSKAKADLASTSCPAPKLSEIVHILKPLEDKYHELGVQLDVESKQINRIEGQHQGNSRRFSEMIDSWQNTSANCSWSALADAVERVGGYDKLVRELRARDNTINGSRYWPKQVHGNTEDNGYYSTVSDSASEDFETEHFNKIPGCGCDKPCLLYTFCAGECPEPTGKKVGVVRKCVQDQATQGASLPDEDYTKQFKDETEQIRVEFAGLLGNICASFEKRNVTKDRVILFLQNAHPLELKPKIDEMKKATNLDQVLIIVTAQACSWFDYKIIKDLVCKLGDDHEKKLLGEYEKEYKKFAAKRMLPKGKKHIEVGGGAREGGKQVIIKIDKQWEQANFSDLDKIRGNLAFILNVNRSDLYLADIREGCIMMTFVITEELAERLFPNKSGFTTSLSSYFTPSQIKSLKDEGVILITYMKLSWRSATEQEESELQYSEVTTEKLKELEGNVTHAGRNYPLWMYFDSIHNLEKFDEIDPPEDCYTSYWDTDTEADEELGNFLFDNVAGDSVSVFSMQEQQNQKEGPIQVDHYTVPQNPRHFSSEIHHSVQQEEHVIERSNKNKKPVASWHPCRSHNSGTYDEPPSIPPLRISSSPALSPKEHNGYFVDQVC